jgi:hypothetical protein
VKEKTDKVWHQYLLYFNDACPKMCYFHHLLVFVHFAYLGQAGRLFMEEDELNQFDHLTPNKWSRVVDKNKYVWM